MFIFHERLRAIRKESGLTQKQVGEAIGSTERNYQRYERGDVLPNFEYLVKLSDVFNVPLDYLMGRSDNPERR